MWLVERATTWFDTGVPATMRLLGCANWWAPGPLGRLYARYGIRESDGRPPAQAPRPLAAAGVD